MLARVVAEAAHRFDDRSAFITSWGDAVSFKQLDERRRSVARWMRERKQIGEGDLVVLAMPSRADYAVAYSAASGLGAITAGINPRLPGSVRSQMLQALKATGAKLVLATEEFADDVPEGLATQVVPADLGGSWPAPPTGDAALDPMLVDPDDERIECLVFTSGSTGRPRAAVFKERQLAAVVASDWTAGRWDGGRTQLGVNEFAGVEFMTKLPWYIMSGAPVLVMDRWQSTAVLRLLDEERIPVVPGTATQLHRLLRDPTFDDYKWEYVKLVEMQGGPVPSDLVSEARGRFDAEYSLLYSTTEAGGVISATDPDGPDSEAFYTVGRPKAGVEIQVRDLLDDGSLGGPLESGQVGELLVRSAMVCAGYWADPLATAELFEDGWLRTGDMASVSDGGLIRLAGRTEDRYTKDGHHVHPVEVEHVLAEHPAVSEIVVVGVPDAELGTAAVAAIEPYPGVAPPTIGSLKAFGQDLLEPWALPDRVHPVDRLPRTPLDKLDRRAVRRDLTSPQV